MATGKVTQVIGTVVDVEFPSEEMPAIYNALETSIGNERLVLEVEQHIGNNWVRCLALGATEGLFAALTPLTLGSPSPFLWATPRSVGCSTRSAKL